MILSVSNPPVSAAMIRFSVSVKIVTVPVCVCPFRLCFCNYLLWSVCKYPRRLCLYPSSAGSQSGRVLVKAKRTAVIFVRSEIL